MRGKSLTRSTGKRRQTGDTKAIRENFTTVAFHELKTHLAAILGSLELLTLQTADLSREQREFIAIANDGGIQLHKLINDILQISRLEPGNRRTTLEVVDIGKTIGECIDAIEIPPNISVKRQFSEEPITLKIDGEHATQLMRNLIDNAVKYSPNGGTISIDLQVSPSSVAVKIQDQGVGIPDEEIDKIFGTFHRAERVETQGIVGTGLGLAICKRIVKLYGGRISVESVRGKGSCFTVILPRR